MDPGSIHCLFPSPVSTLQQRAALPETCMLLFFHTLSTPFQGVRLLKMVKAFAIKAVLALIHHDVIYDVLFLPP